MAKYNDAQNRAYGAGIGYASAKAGKRVPVQEENKESFRAGLEKIRGKKAAKSTAPKSASFSKADKIKYYSGRVDDPKLREGQRTYALRRLQELAK